MKNSFDYLVIYKYVNDDTDIKVRFETREEALARISLLSDDKDIEYIKLYECTMTLQN